MKMRALFAMGLTVAATGLLAASVSPPPRSGTFQRRRPEPPKVEAEAVELETFKLDPGHSQALFRVHHLGAGRFWGRFNEVNGSVGFEEGSATGLVFDISIAIGSVDTGMANLDEHLEGTDFFDAETYPAMTFKSRSAKRTRKAMYAVEGDLTIRGVTKPVTANVEWTGTADLGMGRRCGFETTFTVKRSDFGVSYGLDRGVLGDATMIIVALEGVKPPPEDG